MDNPASDGSSLNCWSSNAKNVDVHYSSGIGNHFFYLLAEGSGAKTINGVAHSSTTCNGSKVTGIGRAAAQKIWYRALTVYMTSSTNYKACSNRHAERRQGPLRREQHPPTPRSPLHGARSPCPDLPPPTGGQESPGEGPVLGTRAPRPPLHPPAAP